MIEQLHIGALALVIAFPVALYVVLASVLGARRGIPELVQSARNGLYAVAGLVSIAGLSLLYALVTHDFSLRYVWENSNRVMPIQFTITAFYSGQAGSLLFWAWTLSLVSALVLWIDWRRHPDLAPYLMAVLMGIEAFFLLLLAFVSNPFETLSPIPADGRGLNPLLVDDGMLVHPPMLLLGYMSVSIPFAFAMAALIIGRLDNLWIRSTRRWALTSWVFLSLGNLFGAWWAYHVLGWGGYWGWDPVENAAFMPWLAMSAFVHSIMVQEKRGMLKTWNMALIIIAFNLALFGTFVVRSGVLSSVHSFAQSALGPLFFAFLGIMLLFSLGLLLWRLPYLRGERDFESLISRESGFLFNNLILVGIALATFFGVIFPLLTEAFQGVKITVGAPFFQQVNGPLFLALMLLMGIGPLLPWRKTSGAQLLRNLRLPILVGTASMGLLWVLGLHQLIAVVAYGACLFVIATIVQEYIRGVRARHQSTGEPHPVALVHLMSRNRSRYGGYLVHLGVVFIGVAVIGSSFFQLQRTATLSRGQELAVGPYAVTFNGLFESSDLAKATVAASLTVREGDQVVGELRPARQFYRNFEQQPISRVQIRSTLFDDLYVIMTDWSQDGNSASFNLFLNPMVSWLWFGGLVLLVGGIIAWWPAGQSSRAVVFQPMRGVAASEA